MKNFQVITKEINEYKNEISKQGLRFLLTKEVGYKRRPKKIKNSNPNLPQVNPHTLWYRIVNPSKTNYKFYCDKS